MLDCFACKEKKKQIILYYFTYFCIILHDFTNCSAFVDIKGVVNKNQQSQIKTLSSKNIYIYNCRKNE